MVTKAAPHQRRWAHRRDGTCLGPFRTRREPARGIPCMSDMRGRGLSAAAFALTVGIVLAGGVALRPVEPAQTATSVDTASIDEIVTSVDAAAPTATAISPAAVTVADVLPTPVAAPASALFPEMKHVWQSLNN